MRHAAARCCTLRAPPAQCVWFDGDPRPRGPSNGVAEPVRFLSASLSPPLPWPAGSGSAANRHSRKLLYPPPPSNEGAPVERGWRPARPGSFPLAQSWWPLASTPGRLHCVLRASPGARQPDAGTRQADTGPRSLTPPILLSPSPHGHTVATVATATGDSSDRCHFLAAGCGARRRGVGGLSRGRRDTADAARWTVGSGRPLPPGVAACLPSPRRVPYATAAISRGPLR